MSPFKEVKIKRKRSSGKPPKKAFLLVTIQGEVKLKSGAWVKNVVGKRVKLLIDQLGGCIALQGDQKKENTISSAGQFVNITDAVEEMSWNLITDSWYEVPVDVTLNEKRVVLRMRKAERMKEGPPMRKRKAEEMKT